MENEPIQVTPSWGNDKWSDPDVGSERIAPGPSDATACSALRICSAHTECHIKECVHKVPHACEHIGMHRVSECYTAKIHSACLTIVDGKIPKSRWKKCDCCNHSEWITEMIPIPSLPNAGGMARELAAQDSDNSNDING